MKGTKKRERPEYPNSNAMGPIMELEKYPMLPPKNDCPS